MDGQQAHLVPRVHVARPRPRVSTDLAAWRWSTRIAEDGREHPHGMAEIDLVVADDGRVYLTAEDTRSGCVVRLHWSALSSLVVAATAAAGEACTIEEEGRGGGAPAEGNAMTEPAYASSLVQLGEDRERWALIEENQGSPEQRAAAIAERAGLALYRAEHGREAG